MKVWKVLNVLKNLKIQKSKGKFQISNLIKLNYEFFISFMFEEKSISENTPTKKSI